MWRVVSTPFIRGMRQFVMTASGRSAMASSTPSHPSWACPTTSWPAPARTWATSSRTSSASSTRTKRTASSYHGQATITPNLPIAPDRARPPPPRGAITVPADRVRADLRGGGALARRPLRAARLAQAPHDAAASHRVELRVEPADLGEDLVGDLLLLLLRRLLDPIPHDRVAVAHGHLGELQPPPVAHLRGAVDGYGHDGRARLERQPPDAPVGLLGELARAR